VAVGVGEEVTVGLGLTVAVAVGTAVGIAVGGLGVAVNTAVGLSVAARGKTVGEMAACIVGGGAGAAVQPAIKESKSRKTKPGTTFLAVMFMAMILLAADFII